MNVKKKRIGLIKYLENKAILVLINPYLKLKKHL